jgi:hypothetical protein
MGAAQALAPLHHKERGPQFYAHNVQWVRGRHWDLPVGMPRRSWEGQEARGGMLLQ